MNPGYKNRLAVPVFVLLSLQIGCTGAPDGVIPVSGFELQRYLGTWYEIARLDHSFERGLSRVTAEYSMRNDGGVRVVNKGYNATDSKWSEAVGKAYFTGDSNVGQLKVSFFGPFYGGYNIVELDKTAYRYSLVVGPDRDYLWILSRTPRMDPADLRMLIDKATELGFATDELIFVKQ
jgi:apolipoprotein D and lipocalin family protein